MFLPSISDLEETRSLTRSFCAYITGLLSLQTILESVIPIPVAILQLWPIYVVVIIWRAMAILEVPEAHTGKYFIITIPTLILPSQIIIRFFYSTFS